MDEIEKLARETGFVERKSSINGFNFLLTFTNGLLNTPEGSLRQLAAFMTNVCESEVSAQAIDERIQRMGAEFLHACLKKAMEIASAPLKLSDDLSKRFDHIFIIDSTNFDLHKLLKDKYKGSSGSASESSMRIQFLFDYVTGSIYLEIGDVTLADSTTLNNILKSNKIDSSGNSLFLSDLGYFKTDTFVNLDKLLGNFYIAKLKYNIKILDLDGNEFNIQDAIKRGENRFDVIVKIGKLECRLIGEKLNDSIINKRLRKANEDNKRKGRTISNEYKLFLTYGFFITNLTKEFDFEILYTIYRLRWQVELIFKTWKSILKIHHIHTAKESNILCKVYGKLITAIIVNSIYRNAQNTFEYSLSFHRILQHIKVIVVKWTYYILENIEAHKCFLNDLIRQVRKSCRKNRQKTRKNIEKLLEEIDFELKMELGYE